ncbi:MAG: hypothetical protein OXB95_09250 [Rhodobacteraceae bacterium]|nr:hypothetical protein [Paracoccaceae bacterium]
MTSSKRRNDPASALKVECWLIVWLSSRANLGIKSPWREVQTACSSASAARASLQESQMQVQTSSWTRMPVIVVL